MIKRCAPVIHSDVCNTLDYRYVYSGKPLSIGRSVLVLIDESGDPGFKIARGSSSHFVVAMVIFADLAQAEAASAAITELRAHCRIKREFKFSSTSDSVKDCFFEGIRDYSFSVRALVVDKSGLYSDELRTNKGSFYNYFVQQLLSHDNGVLKNASVKIDGSGAREFKKELGSYLRKQLRADQVGKLRYVDSESDNLIQLADMCAGAIMKAYRTDDKKNTRWYRVLGKAGRIGNVWPFK